MKKCVSIFTLAVILLITLTACGTEEQPGQPQRPDNSAAQDIGQGSTLFKFEVMDDKDTVTVWNVHTDEKTVGEALLAVDLIEGDLSDFGMYVTAVNGLVADYSVNQAWWAFYIDGVMAMAGVDSTDIEPGKVYAFVYTIG